jgi:hypothetical protein
MKQPCSSASFTRRCDAPEVVGPLVAVFGSAYTASAVGLMAGQAAFTLFAVMLFGILLPQQSETAILRLEDIALGGAVSLLVDLCCAFGSICIRLGYEGMSRPLLN